jgi:uncharacterized protein (TIGR02147 family)
MVDKKNKRTRIRRIRVHHYHDYRQFLNEWLTERKNGKTPFSLSEFCKRAGMTTRYLNYILDGTRNPGKETVLKIAYAMNLNFADSQYLENLRIIADSGNAKERTAALARLQKDERYRKSRGKEIEVYKYLSHWHFVAIRELAAHPEFRADPEWIQSRLESNVSKRAIEQALRFLKKHNYIKVHRDKSAELPEKDIACEAGVFKLALMDFYRNITGVAHDIIERTPVEDRKLAGYVVSINKEDLEEVRSILDRAINDIAALEPKKARNSAVYYVNCLAAPLSKHDKNSTG